ncbi:hypothetical protein R3I94_015155 [Phoxinus phoxinus]
MFVRLNPLTEEKRASFDDVHYNGSYIGSALSQGHTPAEESFSKFFDSYIGLGLSQGHTRAEESFSKFFANKSQRQNTGEPQ